ncbi:Hsp20/alpha crystallin family protein [bacterium]|nr:Hsp20/alpha crystallin family protein [bacterium]
MTPGVRSDPSEVLIKEELLKLLRLLDRLDMPGRTPSTVPVDVWLTDHTIVVRFELPGVDPKSVSLEYGATRFDLTAVKPPLKLPKNATYVVAERHVGPVRQAVELPAAVDHSGVKAVLADGVLTVTCRRVTERRGQRRTISLTKP